MIASGVIIIMGFVLIFIKLPRRTALRMLGYPVQLDITVAALAYVLHWGTFTGAMAAAFAGLACSFITSMARYTFGYIKGKKYFPGKFFIKGIIR